MNRIIADMTGGEDDVGGTAPIVDESREASGLPDRAIQNDDGTVTLPLRRPVPLSVRNAAGKVTETVYAELVFHELFGADMRAISNAKEDVRVDVLMARSLKIPQTVARALFDQLTRKDAEDVVTVAGFL